jgi:acetylglutamate kinase
MKDVTVIKIGGALLQNPKSAVDRILGVGAEKFALVHGGGVQITRMLEKLNVKSSSSMDCASPTRSLSTLLPPHF